MKVIFLKKVWRRGYWSVWRTDIHGMVNLSDLKRFIVGYCLTPPVIPQEEKTDEG